MLGRFDGEKITLGGSLFFKRSSSSRRAHLLGCIKTFGKCSSLIKYANSGEGSLASIGIDTWGVDYGLLDKDGDLLNPYHYRDDRTEGMMEEAFSRMPKKKSLIRQVLHFKKFNTLFQLLSTVIQALHIGKGRYLVIYARSTGILLTGEKGTEFTEASTGQLLDAETGDWCYSLLDAMSIPRDIFTSIEQPGTLGAR